jgi:hypothetical protein
MPGGIFFLLSLYPPKWKYINQKELPFIERRHKMSGEEHYSWEEVYRLLSCSTQFED